MVKWTTKKEDFLRGESRGNPSVSALSFFVGRASFSDVIGKGVTEM